MTLHELEQNRIIKKQIVSSIANNKRSDIINCLVELSKDELTTFNDYIELSKLSKKQLIFNLLNLYDYFDEN